MARSAVVIVEQGKVALIQRVRDQQTYYLFPGGGVEEGETPEAAAIREAYEELGLVVELDQLLSKVQFNSNDQYYYLAHTVKGMFGTGTGEEMTSDALLSQAVTPRHGSPWMS